jgi:hypothetical protein
MFYASIVALAALALHGAHADGLRRVPQLGNHDAPHHRRHLDKRYPPDRATTFRPTTTPAYAAETASPTVSSSSSQTTRPPGQFGGGTATRALVAATTSLASTCAPPYVAPTMISGTGTLPKPTSFVRHATYRDKFLTLDGKPFVVVGPSASLSLDERLCASLRPSRSQGRRSHFSSPARRYLLAVSGPSSLSTSPQAVLPPDPRPSLRRTQDENYGPLGSYTDKARIREALAIAVAMGANTVSLFRRARARQGAGASR